MVFIIVGIIVWYIMPEPKKEIEPESKEIRDLKNLWNRFLQGNIKFPKTF